MNARKGSFLILIGTSLILIALVGGWFISHMIAQSRLSHRQGEQRITSAIAQALATLAIHHLQQKVLVDPNSQLSKYLAKRLDAMGDLRRSPTQTLIKLEDASNALKPLVESLRAPLADLGQFSYTIEYECRQSDFSAAGLNSAFPREKRGKLHIYVTTNYRKNNAATSDTISEDFHFVCQVKVMAALAPVLSKFTLYVENALAGSGYGTNSPWRYNCTGTTINGALTANPPAIPLVFNHGGPTGTVPKTMDELVRPRRGLVFLGGGRVYLNIARGWNPVGPFGEGFHLFAKGNGDGLYTLRTENGVAIMNWEQGMCYETQPSPAEDWWNFIKNSPNAGIARFNSILKLFGTDRDVSVTLVLGDVARTVLNARAYKDTNTPTIEPPYDFMPYIESLTDWQQATDPATNDATDPSAARDTPALQPLSTKTTTPLSRDQTGLDNYKREYASNIVYTPYMSSLAFVYTANAQANPLGAMAGDPVADLMQGNATSWPAAAKQNTFPTQIQVPGCPTALNAMQPLLDAMMVPGDRTAWDIPEAETAGGANAVRDALKRRGLLRENGGEDELAPAGWVFVRGQQNLEFSRPTSLLTSGGIVLEKGSITIRQTIKDNGKALILVARSGSIAVECQDGTEVNASLIAKDKVLLKSTGRPKILGSLAMGQFELANASKGADIGYNPILSAMPNAGSDADSEESLLAASLDPMPLFVK